MFSIFETRHLNDKSIENSKMFRARLSAALAPTYACPRRAAWVATCSTRRIAATVPRRRVGLQCCANHSRLYSHTTFSRSRSPSPSPLTLHAEHLTAPLRLCSVPLSSLLTSPRSSPESRAIEPDHAAVSTPLNCRLTCTGPHPGSHLTIRSSSPFRRRTARLR
jgi:hypothetical protein